MSSYWLTPELIHTDESGMLFGIGDRPGRAFWGLLFAGLGIAAIVAPLVVGLENMRMEAPSAMPPLVTQVLAAAVGLLFIVVGWTVACSIDELQLDLDARTYLRRQGTWPFLRRREGAFDELSHLSLEPEKREYHDRQVVVWMAVLVWKEPCQERLTLFEKIDYSIGDSVSPIDRMRTQLKKIAMQLGLEIQEANVEGRAAQPAPERLADRVRQQLYGEAEARLRDLKKVAAALGVMALGSLFVRVYADWHIAGIVPVSGYLVWALVVLYFAGGLLWEIVAPSDARVSRRLFRMLLLAALTLAAAAICLIAPVFWNHDLQETIQPTDSGGAVSQ